MTARTAPPPSEGASARRLLLPLLAVFVAIAVAALINYRLFGGGSINDLVESIVNTADFPSLLFVNGLVGVSVGLFVWQLRWNALRVAITVVVALLFGFVVTTAFNLDTANRYTRGQFSVTIITEAEPVEAEGVDLIYGAEEGGEFNRPNVRVPLTEAEFTFSGRAGDVISILSFAATRRSEVDLELELRAADGTVLASASEASAEQLARFSDQLRSARDAVIEDFTLPADGIYTIYTRPSSLGLETILSEALQATTRAYDAFLLGALGRINRWAVWIQDATTLIFVGLAIAIVFRARQFSLGAEGQLYFGALVSGIIALNSATFSPWLIIPVALVAAMTAGFLWGLIPGVLKAYLGANELVATLMLNVVAIRFYELVLTFELKPPDAGYVASAPFPVSGQLPPIVGGTQVSIAVFLAIIAVLAVWLLIERTPLGYEIRTVGINRKFADYGGVNTRRTIMLAMAVSGIVAGLAGAHLSMGIHRMLILNISLGLAFEGVVVALLARNNPLVIPFTGLLYAYLRAGAQFMERDANVSFEVVRIIQAVIILLITAEALLAFLQRRRAARAAEPEGEGIVTGESPGVIGSSPAEEKARV
ncbi:MAG: ABC transporter permease [Aggregatilineales bacterium]